MHSRMLTISVFVAGMTSLALELGASRLLGNVFGTSNIVWANIIGLILVYLTAGYFIGGRWADRSGSPRTFYAILLWASFTAGLVPVIARPVLHAAAAAVENLNAAVMAGSFLAVLILFVVPVTLLGCVSPFAIRLAMKDAAQAGRVSGRVYAVSTLGSIVGTFLPVLWLIPTIGTTWTFFVFSLALMTVAWVGLVRVDRSAAVLALWMPVVLGILTWLVLRQPIKSGVGQIYERESAYNYIQVREVNGTRYLMLNEGQAVHSVYNPNQTATYGTWDFFLAAPFFNDPPHARGDVRRLAIVGLAGGTIAKQYTQVYGALPIDGWDIDPAILEVGRRFFDMNEPNLNAMAADGRWGLAHSQEVYSVVAVDAYRPPYIPWQLTTREFFELVREHLTSDGVLVINVGRTHTDRRLVDAMVGTISSVFPSVYVVDVPETFNSIVYATIARTRPENLTANLVELGRAGAPALLTDVLARTLAGLQPTPPSTMVFTDDRAPVETLVNSIVLRFVLSGDLQSLH